MIKVFIDPTYTRTDNADGGIRRVSEAQHKYLPEYGIQPVMSPHEADLIANHGAAHTEIPGVPLVAHCHGLYWARYGWDSWAHDTNRRVVETMARAVAHTAPSRWVARAMARGMFVYPKVIYHGIDVNEWVPQPSAGYVLWNKARIDPVSNPDDMNAVARILPRVHFVSTFGRATANVRITGALPHGNMAGLVSQAGVYLCAVRETFGIGTLEALSCGVPVAGWDYGGQSEIVIQGETGYLAPYGDYDALAVCINKCIGERDRLSANCRADAIARWQWPQRIAQYADVYKRVYERWSQDVPKVTVLVTCHNLARYLPDCLGSILDQSFEDWECVIVDDASRDETPAVAREWCDRDARFIYEPTPENLKLPGALNYGIEHSRGRYILPLDADNMLLPGALQTLANALDSDPGIHIAYGHLDLCDDDGRNGRRAKDWPFKAFDWRGQMGHLNQITSTAMVRREVYERVGGYRERQWRAEDAEFWCRATSFGFRAAKVTEASIFVYRNRADSKSKGEPGDGNWTAWFPWGYAESGRQGAQLYNAGKGPQTDMVPWGAQALPPGPERFWPVHDHTEPLVSVVIPVGPGHRPYLIDALDSLIAQRMQDWECIVVYDDGAAPDHIDGAPWAQLYDTPRMTSGPGVARNIGVKHARGKLVYFLDADDYLLPWTLEKMVAAWQATTNDTYPGDIIYGGWLRNDGDGSDMTIYGADEFKCGAVLRKMQHSVNVLIPRVYHERIGGFDERMSGWEDWDYFIAAQAVARACSTRIDEPLFVYRFRAGHRREDSFGDQEKLKTYIRGKWAAIYDGREHIMCGCNQRKVKAAQAAVAAAQTQTLPDGAGEAVKLSYQAPAAGPVYVKGPKTGTLYKFGHAESVRVRYVRREDAPALLARSTKGVPHFVLAPEAVPDAPAAPAEPPAPIAVTPEWPVMPDAPEPPAEPEPEPVIETLVVEDVEPEPMPAPAPVAPEVTLTDIPVVEARKLITTETSRETLLRWLIEERSAANRTTITTAINRQLSKVGGNGHA